MMPLWKVIETLEEMSCNSDIHNTEAIYTAAYYLKGMQNFCRNFGQLQRDLHHKTTEMQLVISEMQKAAEEGFTNI